MSHHIDGNGVLRHLGAVKKDKPDPRDRLMAAHPSRLDPVPPKYDPYVDGSVMKYVPYRNQERLGTCTAFMGVCQYVAVLVRAGMIPVDLAEMFLYWAVRKIEGTSIFEDSGAQIRSIMKALKLDGVCEESFWRYVDDGVAFTMEPNEAAKANALKHKALYYYRIPDRQLDIVKSAIARGFQVGFGFEVFKNMMSLHAADTGEVMYPEKDEEAIGGHAVVGIGYDDNKQVGANTGALRIRNSWGQNWGMGGDFFLPYRYVTEMLASDFWVLTSVEL